MSTLDECVTEWNVAVVQKWNDARDAKGCFISVYNPRWTHGEDHRLRRETSHDVAEWTVAWFKEQGHDVECVIMPDGESLGVREAEPAK